MHELSSYLLNVFSSCLDFLPAFSTCQSCQFGDVYKLRQLKVELTLKLQCNTHFSTIEMKKPDIFSTSCKIFYIHIISYTLIGVPQNVKREITSVNVIKCYSSLKNSVQQFNIGLNILVPTLVSCLNAKLRVKTFCVKSC